MITYIYPQNLKATANLWLWGLRDFTILCVCALLSVLSLTQLGFMIPAAATPVLWIFNHPSGRNHSAGLYPVCGALLYFHPTEL